MFTNVATQDVFDLFLLKFALDGELLVDVERTARAQLDEQEVEQVLLLATQSDRQICR